MITKFDIGDKVLGKNIWLYGKVQPWASGTVQSIRITPQWGIEYYVRFKYQAGMKIRDADVSGQPAINDQLVVEDKLVKQCWDFNRSIFYYVCPVCEHLEPMLLKNELPKACPKCGTELESW